MVHRVGTWFIHVLARSCRVLPRECAECFPAAFSFSVPPSLPLLSLSLSLSLSRPGPRARFAFFPPFSNATLCHRAVHPSLCSFGRVCIYALIASLSTKNHRRPEVSYAILPGFPSSRPVVYLSLNRIRAATRRR